MKELYQSTKRKNLSKLNKFRPCLWGLDVPTSSKLIYFFENVALSINANIPAGINPVVNNSFKLIPKSGRDSAIEEVALDYAFVLKIVNKI